MDLYFVNQLSAIRVTVTADFVDYLFLEVTSQVIFDEGVNLIQTEFFSLAMEDDTNFVVEDAPLLDVYLISD